MTKHFRSRYPRYPDDSDYKTNASSYYDDLARKNKLIEILAEKIYGYEKVLAENLAEIERVLNAVIDKIGEGFNQEIVELLEQWILDGTLDHIINETLMNKKADKKDLIALENRLNNEITTIIENELQPMNDRLDLLKNTTDSLELKQEKDDKILNGLKVIDGLSISEQCKQIRNSLDDNVLRVGTWNYRKGQLFHPDLDFEIKKTIEKKGIHLIGLQELAVSEYAPLERFSSECLPVFHEIKTFRYDFWEKWQINGILSSFNSINTGGSLFDSSQWESEDYQQERGYNFIKFSFNNQNVSFYNTHLTHLEQDVRLEQFSQLMSIAQNDTSTYKIIVGDFNDLPTLFDSIAQSHGFKIINRNLGTYTKQDTPIDNIIVSNNIQVDNLDRVVHSITDHNLLYADLILN